MYFLDTKRDNQKPLNRRSTENTRVKRKRDKRTKTNLQNITQKTKDRVARTPLKTGMNSGAPEG
jgi:hypothetical protein